MRKIFINVVLHEMDVFVMKLKKEVGPVHECSRFRYVRHAGDFIVGVVGSKECIN